MFGRVTEQKPLIMEKSFTTKEGGSSPHSLLQRWRCSDPIFYKKYSSGATPPQKRYSKAESIKDAASRFNFNQTMPKQQPDNFRRTFSPKDLKVLHSEGSGENESNKNGYLNNDHKNFS